MELARCTASAVLIAWISIAVSTKTSAADFTSLVVFGDSLSDVGNISNATFGLQPGPDYFEGRFSNGPVYSELLADRLDLGPLIASSDDGNNFAFGGGRTSGTSFFEGGFFIQDLDDQVDQFLDEREVDANGLYVVLAGGNDFVLGNATDGQIPARRVEQQITRLANAGVKNLLSINLPLLGDTPRFSATTQIVNQRIESFNDELDAGLDRIESEFIDLNVVRFDLAELFGQVVELATIFGFTNKTEQGIEADDATGFVFWDDVHPAKESHAIMANAVYTLFDEAPLIGDFNFNEELDPHDIDLLGFEISQASNSKRLDLTNDGTLDQNDIDAFLNQAESLNGDSNLNGEVDFTDFLVLSRNFGSTENVLWSTGDFDADGQVAFSDFLLLSRNFGESAAISSVPEPNGWTGLLTTTAYLLYIRQRRGNRRIPS